MASVIWLGLLALVASAAAAPSDGSATPALISEPEEKGAGAEKDVLKKLLQRVMDLDLYIQEMIRNNGPSGIKQIRNVHGNSPTYSWDSFTGKSMAAAHDHGNYDRTVGLGEFVAVMNGVEYRTRHNDYRLVQPSKTSTAYHATDPIDFPPVPHAVTGKPCVTDQMEEMAKWFKAFKEQDYSVRDYRKYFKPLLCYMEGAWIHTGEDIEEAYPSDRHWLDARTWHEMWKKIKFGAQSGKKDRLENFAYLPTTFMGMKDNVPIMAQWTYRILCHPLKDDLPTKRLRLVNDLSSRMAWNRDMEQHSMNRAARFQLYPYSGSGSEGKGPNTRWGLLDELMEQIPGKDNYPGHLVDDAFGATSYNMMNKDGVQQRLNAAYYNRWYQEEQSDAMDNIFRGRSYGGGDSFMAMTNHSKVAGLNVTACKTKEDVPCKSYFQRWTYAIPMEIIYLTPLQRWNPYNLTFYEDDQIVTAGGRRTGGLTSDTAYNGTGLAYFWRTPSEFFNGGEIDPDPADTSGGKSGVLDKEGEMRSTMASGVRMFVPSIPGVGSVRTRYPIMPIHDSGGSLRKEVDALKEVVMNMNRLNHMYIDKPYKPTGNPNEMPAMRLKTTESETNPKHVHEIRLSADEVEALDRDGELWVYTERAAGHAHYMQLVIATDGTVKRAYCDGMHECEDRHGESLTVKVKHFSMNEQC